MVASKKYVPGRGDVVWINFNPAVGHEQKGKRPALVLSPKSYNIKSGLVLICPITSQGKGYPFEVEYQGEKVSGYILTDQIKTVDWKSRKISHITEASRETCAAVMGKIKLLLEL